MTHWKHLLTHKFDIIFNIFNIFNTLIIFQQVTKIKDIQHFEVKTIYNILPLISKDQKLVGNNDILGTEEITSGLLTRKERIFPITPMGTRTGK